VILEVLDGGVLATVQDAGRPDWTHLGVPVSGATDRRSLAIANLLLRNDRGAAAIELTLGGARFVATGPGTIALAGADLGARVVGRGRLAVGRTHRLAAGEEVTFEGGSEAGATGTRCYVAMEGGVDVPLVLGSRSTCLPGGFGGFDGRPLRPRDRVRSVLASTPGRGADHVWPDDGPLVVARGGVVDLRVVPGPWDGLAELAPIDWRVSAAADRVGIRLNGPTLAESVGGEALTHGVPDGAIQVPPDGRPIILSADHQTTGGYRVVGVVIAADQPVVGQLGPGDPVRLVPVSLHAADAALEAERARLDAGAGALREAADWDGLVASAGG
jgi:biotin-dependent carboxylase-like uncharacterized protein